VARELGDGEIGPPAGVEGSRMPPVTNTKTPNMCR
jgi:hypothetical protein